MPTPPPIAIVGAGLAGLTCARALHARGVPLHIFDKGRGPGGRMSTRRHGEALRFDHGAQYVTARSEAFRAQLQRWVAAGVAAPWRGRVRVLERGEVSDTRRATERYVGVPGMSALVSHQARGLEVAFGTRVAPLERDGARWRLRTTGGEELGEFERVVIGDRLHRVGDTIQDMSPIFARDAVRVLGFAHLDVLRRYSEAMRAAHALPELECIDLSPVMEGASRFVGREPDEVTLALTEPDPLLAHVGAVRLGQLAADPRWVELMDAWGVRVVG